MADSNSLTEKKASPTSIILNSPNTGKRSLRGNVTSDEPLGRLSSHRGINYIWLILPYLVTYLHIFLSPYTKVEETPALHAVHDILTHGFSKDALTKYEHVVYPGAVPRSFIPSLIIAGITKPIVLLLDHLNVLSTGLEVQTIIRIVLASLSCTALGHMTITLHRQSPLIARSFVLLSITQFHVPYYAGRTLPNFLALPLVIYAFSTIIRATDQLELSKGQTTPSSRRNEGERLDTERGKISLALAVLGFSATVIRLEIAPLALAVAGALVVRGDISLTRPVVSGAIGGLNGLVKPHTSHYCILRRRPAGVESTTQSFALTTALTSSIDTMFYGPTSHPLTWWPELSAFIFNIPQGRAAEWGVMPWSFYVKSLPKLLLSSLVFWNTGYARGKEILLLAVPSAVIITALSLVGHKEWRFIVYVVPLLNVLAAQAAARLWDLPSQFWRSLWRLAFVGGIIGNIAVTAVLTVISGLNYPGGQIGAVLENLQKDSSAQAKVWIPAAALHSGATVFTLPPTQLHAALSNLTIVRPESSYEASHTPSENSPLELWEGQYDYVVTDDWELFENPEEGGGRWKAVSEVEGYRGVEIRRSWPFARIRNGRRLAVMGRADRI